MLFIAAMTRELSDGTDLNAVLYSAADVQRSSTSISLLSADDVNTLVRLKRSMSPERKGRVPMRFGRRVMDISCI